MRTSRTLLVRRRVLGAIDEFGNANSTWSAPADWAVYGAAPGAMVELPDPNRDASQVSWSILAPTTDSVPSEYDEVALPWITDPHGDVVWFPVLGRPKDYTRGPFTRSPDVGGTVVELRVING